MLETESLPSASPCQHLTSPEKIPSLLSKKTATGRLAFFHSIPKCFRTSWYKLPITAARIPLAPSPSNVQGENHRNRRRQTISSPYDFKHKLHIEYNSKQACFEGYNLDEPPVNATRIKKLKSNQQSPFRKVSRTLSCRDLAHQGSWRNILNRQFGFPSHTIPRIALPPYRERIPAILVMLSKSLWEQNGHLTPHIFRESPKQSERDIVMEAINEGTFTGCQDVRIIADLIKVWFRKLPTSIFHAIPIETMKQLLDANARQRNADVFLSSLETIMPPLESSLLFWLADLLVEVSMYKETNHMGIHQLAIIVAPNLFDVANTDPLVAMSHSRIVVEFFDAIVQARSERLKPSTDPSGLKSSFVPSASLAPLDNAESLESKTTPQ